MRARPLYSKRYAAALSAFCLSCALIGCSNLVKDMLDEDLGETQWYIREIVKGEVVLEEGPHEQFKVFGEPVPILVEEGRFRVTFDLPDDRTRDVVFLVRRQGPSAIEVSCPSLNLEPNTDALPRQDRRINEAITEHTPVSVVRDEWTTFFNDRLRGVFSSDWQLWWDEQE